MRKALVVGIDFYNNIPSLTGCVKDAYEVKNALDTNSDGSVNFGVEIVTSTSARDAIDRKTLKELVTSLFQGQNDIALFYFAGHGHIELTGGYLCTSECRDGDDGLPLGDVLLLADKSETRNKVIVLDSCFSGAAAQNPIAKQWH